MFELLIAVLLSAQCTDERVNKVTPKLFNLGNTPIHRLSQRWGLEILDDFFGAKPQDLMIFSIFEVGRSSYCFNGR